MPEGDSLHRTARRLQVLVGKRVSVQTLHLEGGLVLRSHLRMRGRWRIRPRDGRERRGRPWLVLQSASHEAILWNGPVLELTARGTRRLGPDILADAPDLAAMIANLRRQHPARELGDALLDQRLVAGIGNLWKAEALWHAEVSPWCRLDDVSDDELERVLGEAARLMRASAEGGREQRRVYRRAGRPCPRCGAPIRSRGQGDANRMAYWCPDCQRGEDPAGA